MRIRASVLKAFCEEDCWRSLLDYLQFDMISHFFKGHGYLGKPFTGEGVVCSQIL